MRPSPHRVLTSRRPVINVIHLSDLTHKGREQLCVPLPTCVCLDKSVPQKVLYEAKGWWTDGKTALFIQDQWEYINWSAANKFSDESGEDAVLHYKARVDKSEAESL